MKDKITGSLIGIVILIGLILYVYDEVQDRREYNTCEIIYLDGGRDTITVNGHPKMRIDHHGSKFVSNSDFIYNVSRFKILKTWRVK